VILSASSYVLPLKTLSRYFTLNRGREENSGEWTHAPLLPPPPPPPPHYTWLAHTREHHIGCCQDIAQQNTRHFKTVHWNCMILHREETEGSVRSGLTVVNVCREEAPQWEPCSAGWHTSRWRWPGGMYSWGNHGSTAGRTENLEWSGGGGVVVLLPVRRLLPDLKIHFIPVSNVDSPCFRPISKVKF